MNNKLFRRVATTALSLVFVVSMILGTLPAFAAETDKTNFATPRYIDSTKIITNPVVTNVLAGKTPILFEYSNTNTSTTKSFKEDASIANLTDGTADTEVTTEGYTFIKNDDYCADGSISVKLAFCLDQKTYIENIQVVSSKLSKELNVAKYSVYISDNETDLFSSANLLANVDNTTQKAASQYINTRYTRNLIGQYVGFIFTDPTVSKADGTAYTNNKDNVYLRLSEIAVFGRKNITARGTFTSDDIQEIKTPDTANGEVNIAKDKVFDFKGTDDFVNYSNYTVASAQKAKVVNGQVETGDNHAELGPDRFFITVGDKYYNMADLKGNGIVFNLEGKFELNSLYMIGTNGISTRVSHYAVYAGYNPDTLFTDENFVAEYKGGNALQRSILEFEDNVLAKYVGILILNPWNQFTGTDNQQNQVYPRIKEIAIYGKELPAESAFKNSANDADTTATTNTALGEKNALTGLTASVTYYKDGGKTSTATRGNGIAKLNDGAYDNTWAANVATFAQYNETTGQSKYIGKGIEKGEYYLDIVYKLKTAYDVTGFEIFNHVDKAYRTYSYQIYLAASEQELFDKKSMILDYTNTNGDFRNEFVISDINESYKGKYLGIKVLDPTFDKGTDALANDADGKNNIYPRLTEVTLYGKQITIGDDEEIFDNVVEIPGYADDYIADSASIMVNHYSKVSGINEDMDAGVPMYLSDNSIFNEDGSPNEARWGGCKFAYYDGANAHYLGKGINEGDVYMDIIYDFDSISDISAIALINCNDINLRTYKYNIYVGNTLEDLFNNPPIKEVLNDEAHQRNVFNLKKTNGGQPIKARYVAIRILDPTYNKGVGSASTNDTHNNVYTRLYEIAIFGKITSASGNPYIFTDNKNELPAWGRNLSKVSDIRAYVGNKADNSYNTTSFNKPNALKDGVLDNTDSEFQGVKFASYDRYLGITDNTSNGTGNLYLDIVIDLHSEAYIEGVALYNANISELRTGEFEIYASKTHDELFKGEPLVSQTNESQFSRCAYDFAGLSTDSSYTSITEDVYASYIGIRILNPTQKIGSGTYTEVNEDKNNIHTRLREIAVFGQYNDPDFVYVEPYTAVNNVMTKEELAAHGKSLIADTLYKHSWQNGASWYSGSIGSKYKKESITDGDPTTKADYKADISWDKEVENEFDLVFEIGDIPYNIEKVIYLGDPSNSSAYYTGWYKVFASDDLDLLFDPSNLIFEYNAVKNNNPDPISQGQIINIAKPKRATYVALRIIYPVTTANQYIYGRISEFAVYGTPAEIDRTPTNLAAAMPIEAYLTNNKDSRKEVTDKNYSVKEVSNTTDGKVNTTATIDTKGDRLDIVVNLCQDVDISEIKVLSVNDASKYINKYNLYASSDYNDLWDSSSLVYSYNGKGNPKQITSKVFSKPKNMRYVRVEILDDTDSVTIGDIQVIGEAHELLRNKNFARNNADFEVYSMKLNNTGYKVINSGVKELHDGSVRTTSGITGGVQGESTQNLELNLKDFRNVNSISLLFPRNAAHYSPTLTHIYLGETQAEVQGEDAKPDYVLKGLPKDNKISIDIKPTFAQYVRISFVEGGHSKGIFDEMVYALTEVYVYGTAVEGMNPESSNVIEFEDEKLGIKWGVVRKCDNDVFNDVVDSTVTVSKVTNWQKRSLEKTPYLKVIGDKKYTFKFYDALGNEVTEFGNRKLEFNFTMMDEMDDGTAMVGYAGNKWYIQPYDSAVNELGYITAYEIDGTDFTYTRLCITNSNDPYWDNIGALEDYGDEPQQFAPSTSIDESLSTAPIITEDKNFSIKPRGTLRLSKLCQLTVEVITGDIPENVYTAVELIDDPNLIAATYTMQLLEEGYTYEFDGKVKTMIHIPEDIKGYFSGYKLVKVDMDGTAEYIDFEKKGDYIYFDTNEICDFALVGTTYHSDGSAVEDDYYDVEFDEYGNPITGEANTSALFLNIAILALALIVLVNTKKFASNR